MSIPLNVITGEIRQLDLDRRTGRMTLHASTIEFVCVPGVLDEVKRLFVSHLPCKLGGQWVSPDLFDVWQVMAD